MIKEYSRILKFDFPSIPILGSLLLLLVWLNDSRLIWFLLDENGKPIVSVVATTVIFLGTAGLFVSQLISFSLFDQFFEFRNRLIKSHSKKFNGTTEEWFEHLCSELVPISREDRRDGDHSECDRQQLEQLSQGQIHAAIHALEINCREDHPELSSQIEQFYSMYVMFSVLGLVSAVFVLIFFWNLLISGIGSYATIDVEISSYIAVFDIVMLLGCFFAAIHARRFKELLRRKLLNSSRSKAVDLMSKWYQVKLSKSRIETSVR